MVLVSLAAAMVSDAAVGRYRGMAIGETALLRTLVDLFGKGDVAVMDRFSCSFMVFAGLLDRALRSVRESITNGSVDLTRPAVGEIRPPHSVEAARMSGLDGDWPESTLPLWERPEV